MWTDYKDADIHFTIADVRFHTLNFVYERFQRSILTEMGAMRSTIFPGAADGLSSTEFPMKSRRTRFLSPVPMWSMRRVPFSRTPCANTVSI